MTNLQDRGATANGKSFGFSRTRRRAFVASYVMFKTVFLWRDVRRPRFRLFIYEIVYSICRALDRPARPLLWLRIDRVSTVFGDFKIRPGSTDTATVSPAFERLDVDHLLSEIRERLTAGRSVLFVDVGADVGTYTVSVANQLRSVGDLAIVAFEPSPSSYELFSANVESNGLAGMVSSRQLALGDGSTQSAFMTFDYREPGGSELVASSEEGGEEVQMSTLDVELSSQAIPDVVVLKMDVEGSETGVLEGAKVTLAAAKEAFLLVEDFIDTSIVQYLERTGWSFQEKFTPYNSFWIRRNAAVQE